MNKPDYRDVIDQLGLLDHVSDVAVGKISRPSVKLLCATSSNQTSLWLKLAMR